MSDYQFRIGQAVTALKEGVPRELCCAGKITDRKTSASVGAEYRVDGKHWHPEADLGNAEHGEDSATADANRANNEPG